MKLLPTAEFIRSKLDFNPETGRLHWRPLPPETDEEVWKRHWNQYVGKQAGYTDHSGRIVVELLRQKWFNHRLVWQYHYGDDDALTLSYGGKVTCLDGDFGNCRLTNLALSHHLPTDPRRRSIGEVTVRTRVVGR